MFLPTVVRPFQHSLLLRFRGRWQEHADKRAYAGQGGQPLREDAGLGIQQCRKIHDGLLHGAGHPAREEFALREAARGDVEVFLALRGIQRVDHVPFGAVFKHQREGLDGLRPHGPVFVEVVKEPLFLAVAPDVVHGVAHALEELAGTAPAQIDGLFEQFVGYQLGPAGKAHLVPPLDPVERRDEVLQIGKGGQVAREGEAALLERGVRLGS